MSTFYFLAAAHHLAWTQYPALWLCESCCILWLVLRSIQSRLVQGGVLLMLCGLMLNALVTEVNAGHMPVVGMSSRAHPLSSTWQAATSNTRLPFLADQRQLGMFSVGDIALLSGGILVVAICMRRILRKTVALQSVMSTPVPWLQISGRAPSAPRVLRAIRGRFKCWSGWFDPMLLRGGRE